MNAEKVIHCAPCPVFVMRSKDQEIGGIIVKRAKQMKLSPKGHNRRRNSVGGSPQLGSKR